MAQQEPKCLGKLFFCKAEGLECLGQFSAQGWGMWPGQLVATPSSRGCSVSRHLGHGHQGTCPTQFLSRTSTVITAALGFCTSVMKCVRAQALLGASKQDRVPFAPLLSVLHCWGLVMLPALEKFPKWLSMAAAKAAQTDSGGIDGHSRQRSRVRDTWSREIPQEESRDRSCRLINTHCMWRDSKIKQVAGRRC